MGKFNHRVGSKEVPHFGGVRRESDPGSIPARMFRDLVNTRFRGGIVVSRGGQSKMNADALAGCVVGIFGSEFSFGDLNSTALIFAKPNTASGGQLFLWSSPLLSTVDLDSGLSAQNYNVAVNMPPPPSVDSAAGDTILIGAGTDLLLLNDLVSTPVLVTSAPSTISSLAVKGTDLFLGVYNTTAEVYKWDGTALTLDKDFGVAGAVSLGVYNDSEVLASVGGDGYNNDSKLWQRSAAGVWTQLTFPTGAYRFWARSFVMYLGKLWIGGTSHNLLFPGQPPGPAQILSWDGATLLLERDIAVTAGSYYYAVGALAVLDGGLYYGWGNFGPGGSTSELAIGLYDGVTWTDTHKDLAAEFGWPRGNHFNSLFVGPSGRLQAIFTSVIGEGSSATWFVKALGAPSGSWALDSLQPYSYESYIHPQQQHPHSRA